MPHDPLEVYAGAGLAGAEVLGLREGRGVSDGPGINLEIEETMRKLLTRAKSDSDSGVMRTVLSLLIEVVMMMKYNSIAPLIKYLIW